MLLHLYIFLKYILVGKTEFIMLFHFFFILVYNKSVMNLTYQKKEKRKSVLNFISPFSLQVLFLEKIEIGGETLTLIVLQLVSGTFESL